MPSRFAALAGLAATVLAATSAAAPAVPAAVQSLVQQGAHGVPGCITCHGPAGEGNAAAGYPRLAGLPGAYLRQQIAAFADGSREHPVMAQVAQALNGLERAQLADYYAALRPAASATAGNVAGTTTAPSADVTRRPHAGVELALHGRWGQGMPACVQCHGRGGVGIGAVSPPLAGQPAAYLAAQLRAWRSGTRHEDPMGLMRRVASALGDADIDEVSRYFADFAAADARLLAAAAPQTQGGKVATLAAVEPPTLSPAGRAIPDSDFGRVVELGRRIFNDTPRYAAAWVGNRLSCANCHLDQGRRVGSAPMWAAWVSYPAYRAKTQQVNTFAERLQGCFQYSMNGHAPPPGDAVLVALESYAYWMAQGVTVDPDLPGRGYPKVPAPAQSPDYARGERVYADHCALCHATDGAGQAAADGSPGFPALWGADSFNWGAGMGAVSNAAAFIKANMPLGASGTLTDQQAWDVARFMDSHDRPQDPRFTGSVAATRARFHAGADWVYGTMVNGELLGSRSPRPGPRAP